MFGAKKIAGDVARKAGYITTGAVFFGVGAGFLTAAGWSWLAIEYGHIFASCLVGFVYLGIGALFLAVGASKRIGQATEPAPVRAVPESPTQLVLLSFLQGLEQGRTAKRAVNS